MTIKQTTPSFMTKMQIVCVLFLGIILAACSEPVSQQHNNDNYIAPAQVKIHKEQPDFCKRLPRPEYAGLKRIAYASDWFELYQVAPGVTAIYEPFNWQEVISYLIEGDERAMLFDTGNGIDDIQRVARFLTSKPIVVLNSHSHYDHVGGNYQFDIIYGMDTTFTQRRQQGRTSSDIGIEVSAQATCILAPKGKTPLNHVGKPYPITHVITDGDSIDLGGRKLTIMHIPGHTPDAIALIDNQNGLMWTGDSFYAGPIWLNAQETDLVAYRASLDKMIAQIPNLQALLPAHNTPKVDPQVLLHVASAFDKMMAGKLEIKQQGDGNIEYHDPNDSRFSFLMRDEPLPYQ